MIHLSFPSFPLQVLIGAKRKFLDRPAALAGMDSPSARILSVNPPAVSEGVRRGMMLAEARKRCREIDVFMPRPDLFLAAGRNIVGLLSRWSPMIEGAGGGFYVDLTGTRKLFGPVSDTAGKLIHEFEERYNLVSSAGIGASKLVGKAASSMISAPGLTQVMPAQEAAFLSPFPLKRLLPKEPEMLSRLAELGIERVADLQAFSQSELVSAFGRNGTRLHLLSRGIDFSPVSPAESAPEIDEGESMAEASNDLDLIGLILLRLSACIGRRLRDRNMSASALKLLAVYRDGRRAERKVCIRRAVAFDREIYDKAKELAASAISRRVQVIYIGLRASALVGGYQPDLFGDIEKNKSLYRAIDHVRRKYGASAIRLGVELA